MATRWPRIVFPLLVIVGVGALWLTRDQGAVRAVLQTHPERIMGTSCRLLTVEHQDAPAPRAKRALAAAEAALRTLESRMSTWIASSELSRFNSAEAQTLSPLSADTLLVLRRARDFFEQTTGAFDVTCQPLIALWRRAGKTRRLPSPNQLKAARAASRWDDIRLENTGARKLRSTARVDVGGIAKGLGIDRALEALRATGVAGGLVDVGGDLRVFGLPPQGEHWQVVVRDPFDAQARRGKGRVIATLRLREGAVCTSGNYARFVELAGRHYSHIVDPRTGQPAAAVPSATVIASDTMTADSWATALSVLGPAGFARLPKGVEAMIVLGQAGNARAVATAGFLALLAEPLPYPVERR